LNRVEYEPLPAIFDPMEAMKPDAPLMYPDMPIIYRLHTSRLKPSRGHRQGVQGCRYRPGSRYTSGFRHIIVWTPTARFARGRETSSRVWSSAKYIWSVLDRVCEIMGLPETKVKVIAPYIGGDFGGKAGQVDAMQAVICATLARRTGRPVRLQFTREEEIALTHHSVGPFTYVTRGGVKREDGKPTAMDLVLHSNQGGHNISGLEAPYVGSGAVALYKFESCKFVDTRPTAPQHVRFKARVWRSRGFLVPEQFVDELAEAVGMDPVEWRTKWAIRQGDPTATRLVWGEFAGGDYQLLLKKGAELFAGRRSGRAGASLQRSTALRDGGWEWRWPSTLPGVNNEMGVVRSMWTVPSTYCPMPKRWGKASERPCPCALPKCWGFVRRS